MAPELRRSTPEDAAACHAVTQAGLATYRSFAGPGYRPPPERADDLGARLARSWGVVAEDGGEVVAFGAFEPARADVRTGPLVPGLAHVWAVFAAPSHWGTGVAAAVLEALVAAMRGQGHEEARLYTPALHLRARRFYEREGWEQRGEPFNEPALGLDLVQLRRAL